MSGDKKRTSTLSIGIPPLETVNAEQTGPIYDRADLSRTPLAKLVELSGIVIGQKNLLDGFSDQIKLALRELDSDFRFKLNRYERYKSIGGSGVSGKVAEFRDAAKGELNKVKEDIADLLAEKFKVVFEFLIDNLEDERLDKLGLDISQKKVATILYDHLDYYEDTYALGKGATLMVMRFALQKAAEKGERIVRNMQRDEMDIRSLQKEVSGATEGLTGTFPGIGTAGELPSRISEHRVTLPPPAFEPDLKLPPSVKAPEGFLPPPPSQSRRQIVQLTHTLPPEPFVADPTLQEQTPPSAKIERYITGNTDPYLHGAIVPGSYEESVQKEAEETLADLNLRAGKIPVIPGFDPESLTSILDDGIEDQEMPTSVMANPIPVVPRSFSSAEVPGVVGGKSVSYGPETASPPQPMVAQLKNEAKVVVEVEKLGEVTNRVRFERAATVPEVIVGNLRKIDAPAEADEKTSITERKQILPPIPRSWWSKTKEKASGWYSSARESVSKLYNETKNSVASWYKSAKDWVSPKVRKVVKPLAVVAGLAAFGAMGVTDFNSTAAKKSESTESSKLPTTPAASAMASTAPSTVEKVPSVNPSTVDLTQTPSVKVPITAPEFTPTFANVLLNSKSPLVLQIIKEGKLTIGKYSITDSIIGSMRGLTNDQQKLQVAELEKQINLGLGVYFNEHFGTPAKVAESLKDPNLRNLYRTAKRAQEKGWFASYHTKERFPQAYLLATQMLGDSHELGHDTSDNPSAKVKAFVQGNMFQAKLPGSTINLKKANGHYHVLTEYMMGIFEGKNVKDMMKTEFAATSTKDAGDLEKAPAEVKKPPVVQPLNAPKIDDKNNAQQGTILPNIIGRHGLLDSMDESLDSTGTVEFDLPLSMTTRQENEAILPTLIEKLIALNPQANPEIITKLVKRYGFIGVKSWARTKPGHFKVELHPNFLKILKPELKKSSNKVS